MALQQFDEILPILQSTRFFAGSGTTVKTIVDAGAGTNRVDMVLAFQGDTIAHAVRLIVDTDGDEETVGWVDLPAATLPGAGALVSILAALMPSGQAYLVLGPLQALKAVLAEDVSAGAEVVLTTQGGRLS